MSRKVDRTLMFCLTMGLTLVGCQSAPVDIAAPPITGLSSDGSQSGILETGRTIYTTQCTKCHRVKSIQDYSSEEWSSRIMPKMAKKAKLSPGQTDAVLAYVMAVLGPKSGVDGQ